MYKENKPRNLRYRDGDDGDDNDDDFILFLLLFSRQGFSGHPVTHSIDQAACEL